MLSSQVYRKINIKGAHLLENLLRENTKRSKRKGNINFVCVRISLLSIFSFCCEINVTIGIEDLKETPRKVDKDIKSLHQIIKIFIY